MKTLKIIQFIITLPIRVGGLIVSPILLLIIFVTTDFNSQWDIDFGKKCAKKVISLGLWK